MAKINDDQFLYNEVSETLRFSEPELDTRPLLKEESKIIVSSEKEKSISTARSKTQATVSQQKKSGFRRCSGLSEY